MSQPVQSMNAASTYSRAVIAAYYNCPDRNGRSPEVVIDFPDWAVLTPVVVR